MKKILLVAANNFSKSGVPTVFMNIVRNLSSKDFRFDIIYFDDSSNYFKEEFLRCGGHAFLIKEHYKNSFLTKLSRYINRGHKYRKALKIMEKNGPYDAIHCFKEYRSDIYLKAAFKSGISKRIYHSNNMLSIGGNILNKILSTKEKKVCRKFVTNLIGCSSQSCESVFGKDFQYEVFNNPYDVSKFYFSKINLDIFDSNNITFVQTAGFCDGKNQLFSLEVILYIKKVFPKVILHLIGSEIEKNYLTRIKKRVKELDLENNVSFHKYDVDQKMLFDRSNYFIFPTKTDAFGIVLIEAQACGLKCIASDSVPESTNVGGCARLSLSIGANKWADFILKDFANKGWHKKQYDCSSFSNENIIQKYIDLYREQTDE